MWECTETECLSQRSLSKTQRECMRCHCVWRGILPDAWLQRQGQLLEAFKWDDPVRLHLLCLWPCPVQGQPGKDGARVPVTAGSVEMSFCITSSCISEVIVIDWIFPHHPFLPFWNGNVYSVPWFAGSLQFDWILQGLTVKRLPWVSEEILNFKQSGDWQAMGKLWELDSVYFTSWYDYKPMGARNRMWWFEREQPPLAYTFRCLVPSWWNCCGKD